MKVKIKKLSDKAVVPYKTHTDDYAYDVVAVSEKELAPNVWKYGIGLAFEVEDTSKNTDVKLAILASPRSSVWKTGMVLSNGVGIVDETYRGEVSFVFYHVNPELPRYKVGDRIGQIHICATPTLEFEITDNLTTTDRGTNGYGSTGK